MVFVPSAKAAPVWVIENAETSDNVGSAETSLALDSNDAPHISYYVTSADLLYADKSSGSWTSEVVESAGSVGRYSSLKLDASGSPHISFTKSSPSTNISYATKSGSDWNIEIVALGGSIIHPSLAFDSSGNPHISYLNNTNKVLMYASKSGSGWTNEVVATNAGGDNSLALDSADNPHISYFDITNTALMYASKSGSGWTVETVDNEGNTGQYSSLALDSSDNPHISYYGPGVLMYASKSAGTWTTEIADSPGPGITVGEYTSLALDSTGNPHISYYDERYDDLKYATKTGTTWTQTTVDSTGSVGMFTSIALDSNDKPHISYLDTTNHDLKYASLVNSGQSVSTATGSGTAVFASSAGTITNLNAVSEGSLPEAGKPEDMTFPHGLFSFNIEGLSAGQTVTVNIQLPTSIPVGSQYWKYQAGAGWFQIPMSSDNGDNVISITLTDGGTGDADGVPNGVIVDPGGAAIASTFVVPETAFGTALVSMIAAFVCFTAFKRNRAKHQQG